MPKRNGKDNTNGHDRQAHDLAAETLTGDLRDWLLRQVQHLKKPWQQLSESEQRDVIYAAESAARTMVRKAVTLIAAHEFEQVFVTVGKFTVKEGAVKAEFTCSASDRNLIAIKHAGSAVLVLADPEVFTGERSKAAAEPDEPGLPLGDDAPTGEAADAPQAEAPQATA